MKLIVGLGNIGPHFEGTRHNTGFMVVESLASDWQDKPKFKATVAELTHNGQKILLAKPTTYYNQSGEAVRAIKDFYKLDNADILLVHDELALPFGTLRARLSGSDAGNNGMKSVIAHLGPDIARLRIGIANDLSARQDAADFVLSTFRHAERKVLPDIFAEAHRLVWQFVAGSLEGHSVTIPVPEL